jgi:SAM-dependent methyltransferase
MELCSSPFIMWATDHDLRHPSYLSRLIGEFAKDDSVVLAYSRTVIIDVDDNVVQYAPDLLDTRNLAAVERFSKIMWHYMWGNMVFGLYRSDALRELLQQDFSYAGMDHLQMAFLGLLGSIAQVDEFLFFRRDNRPEEDEDAMRRRQLDWCVKAGPERIIPMNMLGYGHIKAVQDSCLTAAEKELLYADIRTCFVTRFGEQMLNEARQLAQERGAQMEELSRAPASRAVCALEFARSAEIHRLFFPPVPEAGEPASAVDDAAGAKGAAADREVPCLPGAGEPVQAVAASASSAGAPRPCGGSRAGLPLPEPAEISSVAGKPSVVFINTFYEGFLSRHYQRHAALGGDRYAIQLASLQSECFGDCDFYSAGLQRLGWQADDFIVNAPELQAAWARENGFAGAGFDIAVEQIRRRRPDVVYLQDLNLATREFLAAIRPHTRLIVGQIASPLPPLAYLDGFDVIFSSFPHFTARFRQSGIAAYYQPLAFDPRVLERTAELPRDIPLSFIGGISSNHGKGLETLEQLAGLLPLQFWGYGAGELAPDSPIAGRHHGEAWGRDMFTLLRRSRITLNRHIDVAEDYANNMRLFEATGCGALLITDYKENLDELFEIGKEVIAYRSPEECAALVKYYLAHPDQAAKIAQAGQQRTLKEHSYHLRMEQTAEILERQLRYRCNSDLLPAVNAAGISYGHTPIEAREVTQALTKAWQNPAIPARQRSLVQEELSRMYRGDAAVPYLVLAEILRPHMTRGARLLEIGCASGYYYEILEYLLSKRIDYTGVDYSEPLIAMARDYYPKAPFYACDGACLLFADRSFDIVVSSCVLLHVPNYRNHIYETARVADRLIVAARTPICKKRPTLHMKKFAYGVETVELVFNEGELIREFAVNGFVLLRAIQYQGDDASDLYTVTYLFGRS